MYNRTTKQSLESEILIQIRKYHIKEIVKQLIHKNIISNEYLDNLIKIENIKLGILDNTNTTLPLQIDVLETTITQQHNNTPLNNTQQHNITPLNNTQQHNNNKRIEIIEKILQKECLKGTAKLIQDITS